MSVAKAQDVTGCDVPWGLGTLELFVQVEGSGLRGQPGRDHPIAIPLLAGRKVLEMDRVGPGRNDILGDDFAPRTLVLPDDEACWIHVGVYGMRSTEGWMRASEIGEHRPAGARVRVDTHEGEKLLGALTRFDRGEGQCQTDLYFTHRAGQWHVSSQDSSALTPVAKLVADEASYRGLIGVIEGIAGTLDVSLVEVLTVIGLCP